jgi:hypothetical protein
LSARRAISCAWWIKAIASARPSFVAAARAHTSASIRLATSTFLSTISHTARTVLYLATIKQDVVGSFDPEQKQMPAKD